MSGVLDSGVYDYYATLADPATKQVAETDMAGWLRSLPRPAIIDEAQLVNALPLALKELIDELGPGRHFLLTGSASIGRAGLGGADPLVRRSRRFLMSPLTTAELERHNGPIESIVDRLFEQTPVAGTHARVDDERMRSRLLRGGFPAYVLSERPMTERSLYAQIRSDLDSTLGDHVLPDERFDAYRARALLDALLRTPGGILNASKLGGVLELDRRTVDRYLDVLQRRFLVNDLPNLSTRPRQQGRPNSKIHPADTSFAVESLHRAGREIRSNRELFGQLLESHVVNQILAAREWAEVDADAFYWRKAKDRMPPEVDLVLRDREDRHIGIEVKASRTIDPAKDLRGLRALADEVNLRSGFVAYMGTDVIRLAERFWAIPIDLLGREEVFESQRTRSKKSPVRMESADSQAGEGGADASLFLSYVHDDDAYLDGAIVRFALDLQQSYAYLFGAPLELFVDRNDIVWGERWRERIGQEIDRTLFLLAMITPRYLKSQACRDEFTRFNTAAKKAGHPRQVLSVMWTDISQVIGVSLDDPVRSAVLERQYLDGVDIGALQPGTAEYRSRLEELARRLHETIRYREPTPKIALTDTGDGSGSGDEDANDIVDLLENFESLGTDFQFAIADFQRAFENVLNVLSDMPDVANAGPSQLTARFVVLEKRLHAPSRELEQATRDLAGVWNQFDRDLTRFAQAIAGAPKGTVDDLRQTLWSVGEGLEIPGLEEARAQVEMLGRFSRHLRSVSRAMVSAIDAINGIKESASSWKELL